MRPELGDRLGDDRIAGERVDRRVEADVDRDPVVNGSVIGKGAPGFKSPHGDRRRLALRRAIRGDPLGGETGGEPFERRAHLVEVANAGRHRPARRKAALALLDHQTLTLKELKRMADRLARDAEALGELFLGQPFARRQRAVGDRIDQPQMNLIDQVLEAS